MKISRALRAALRVAICLYLGSILPGFAATDWSPATLLTQPFDSNASKIQITPGSRWGLFRESDSISIQTTDNSAIQILDLNGSSIYSGNPTNLTLPRGHYIVECNGDRNQFAVLPDDYAGASFLSTEADNGGDSSLTARLAAVNPSWVRTGDGEWATVEAQQGVFNWTAMDQTVAANAGRKIIAYIGDVTLPAWVNSNNFVASYTQFVQALANRYPNQLAYIEAWNEPWYNKFPNTTNLNTFVAFYLQLVAQARSAVKPINPAIQMIGPSWTSIVKDESLAMTNSIALFDGWSWHDYGRGLYAPDQEYGSPNFSPALETDHLIPYFGNFVTQKPLLVDELGLYGQSALGITNTTTDPLYRSNLDWYRGMCRTIKTVVMYRACGVEALSPHVLAQYAQPPDPNLELYGWDQSGTNSAIPRGPHPKTSAFLMACYWLNGATLVNYRTPGQQAFLYAWQLTNNTSIVFAWAAEGHTVPLQNNGLEQPTDIYGRTNNITALTEEPALFFSNILDPLTLLNAVRLQIPGITNSAPVIDPLPTESVVTGQLLQITVSATDADYDPITYSATTLPPGATFNPGTQTLSWTPDASASGPYTATFVVTDSLGATNSLTTTITVFGNLFEGLLAHWKFDESTGTIAADSIGRNNGTLIGFNFATNSGWASGVISNALNFGTGNDYVLLDSSQINLTNNFAFSLWLKPQNATDNGAVMSVCSFYQASGLRFFVAGNSLLLQGQTTAGWQDTIFANNAIQDGVWYHVAVVYDNSILSVYVNGTLQGSTNWGGDMIMNSNAVSQIGHDGTEGADYFSGVIDDVMIFQRILTAGQVQALYHSGDQPLHIGQLLGTLNFAKTNADTCTIRGAFALPSNFNFSNKVVTLNIGGAETSFTLDSKGRGLIGLSRFNKPTYSKTTGLWTFNAMLRNGSWQTPWAAHGLANATIASPGVSVTLPVVLAIDSESFTATSSRHYTSRAGKTGSAR
jgi:Concanavalin A-like lectin/glucanases superfamily/Putative Ig domain